jgi:hypothetical protein
MTFKRSAYQSLVDRSCKNTEARKLEKAVRFEESAFVKAALRLCLIGMKVNGSKL